MINRIKNYAKQIESDIINWRRELHKIPEVAHDVPLTADFITKQLDSMGIEYRKGVGGYGIVAVIEGRNEGKTFGIRADIDALAVEEETGLPFASIHKGRMHACGHDAHTAMALGAAKILQEIRDELPGRVKIIFQPAEEGPGGAKPMIEDGALKDPDVDAIIGLHIGNIFKEVGNGQIGVGRGAIMACLDSFKLTIKGKGGHGAMPDVTVDPIAISVQVVSALQTLISRELKPSHPAVITVGKLHGGTAYNIIPEKVEMEGTARFIHEEDRQRISNRIGELAAKIAEGMRGSCTFEYVRGYPPLVCDDQFTDYFIGVAAEVIGRQNIIELAEPTMGGEDMAYFLQEVPGTFFMLGSAKETGEIYPHHHPKFDIDEGILHLGTSLFAATAYSWLKDNQ